MNPSTVPGPFQSNDELANQVVITIAVEGNRLKMFPCRSGDIMTYYRKPGARHSPVKPVEVRWVVRGLTGNRKVQIRPKEGNTGIFLDTPVDISPPNNSLRSGQPRRGPLPGTTLTWEYEVALMDNGTELDLIDPDIQIKQDP
jgi:hypothetical protein